MKQPSKSNCVPALGFHWLTPYYDAVVGATTRESMFVRGNLGVPNTGRFEFSLQPNLSWAVNKNLTLNVNVNVPIYTRIRTNSLDRDVQLTESVGVFVGMSWHF